MLSKPGISASVRKLIMKRHTAGIILFIVCNLYTLGFCLQVSIKGFVNEETAPVYQLILKAIYLSSGLLGPLLRLNEPAFLHAAQQTLIGDIKFILCIRVQKFNDEEALNDQMYRSRKMSLDESRRPNERTINGSVSTVGSSFNEENSLM